MDNYCMQGAYRGVPYKIHHDDNAPWDLVDPRNRIDDVVFMGYGGSGHINYGDSQEALCEQSLKALVGEKIATIIKNSDGEAAAKLTEDERADREEEIFDDLTEALTRYDMDDVKKILDLAEIDYRAKYLTGDCQGQYCETLYFFEDGRKFSADDNKVYEMEMTEINSWIWGRCYTVEVADEMCGGFISDDCSNIEDKSPMSYFIKERIDNLFVLQKAPYTIVGDYATATGDYDQNKLEYDRSTPVRINVKTLEEAKIINGTFNGHAILVDNEKSNQK